MSLILLIIRYSGLLLFLFSSFISIGQDLDKRISIDANNQPLKEVLSEISTRGNILFSYSPQQIPASQKVSAHFKNEKVRVILDKILLPLGIQYVIMENQIVLKPAQKTESMPPGALSGKKFTISGHLREKANGEVLIGANVYDQGSYKGTTTNSYGFFSLTLPEGDYRIIFSIIGYEKQEKAIHLNADVRLQVELAETAINIHEVEIISKDEEEDPLRKSNSSNMRFTASTLKEMPGFAGNIDVIKSLHSVPGITSFGDGSTFYYVRGGNSDQNLLLIDEAPIYNPSHLFGFFSALSPDAIKDVKAYKGDFPASYGGRLSSVIDIRARDGNLKRIGFSGNLGPFASDLTLEGPIRKERSSFIISGRKSNLNWLNFSPTQNRAFSILFYDLNVKLNLRISDNDRIFITAFNGMDDFSVLSNGQANTFGIQWKNSTGTLRWNHIFNPKLFANTTFFYSKYDYFLFISRQQNNYWKSAISNGTFKTDFTWYQKPGNTFRAGVELSNHHSDPGNVYISDPEIQRSIPQIPQYHSLATILYLSNERELASKLLLNYGARLTLWRDFGPTTVYLYDGTHKVIDTATVEANVIYQDYLRAEPRINLSYAFNGSTLIRAGYSRTAQFVQMLSNSTSPFTSLEVWAPSTPTIQPQHADQLTLGFVRNFAGGIHFSLDTYLKKSHNQIDYKDHANMLYNPLIEGELRFGTTSAYGIEALLRKSQGKFTGWMGYSYSKVRRSTEGVNNNLAYPAHFDRPNTICLNISYKSGKRWDFSANWIYLTGAPVSTPDGFYNYNGYMIPIYGEKNNDRLPDYHRLDISATCWLNKPGKKFRHSLVLSAYNLYGRNNPFSVNFNKIMNDNGRFIVPTDLDGSYEIIPTQLSVAGVIPSLNYTFRF